MSWTPTAVHALVCQARRASYSSPVRGESILLRRSRSIIYNFHVTLSNRAVPSNVAFRNASFEQRTQATDCQIVKRGTIAFTTAIRSFAIPRELELITHRARRSQTKVANSTLWISENFGTHTLGIHCNGILLFFIFRSLRDAYDSHRAKYAKWGKTWY